MKKKFVLLAVALTFGALTAYLLLSAPEEAPLASLDNGTTDASLGPGGDKKQFYEEHPCPFAEMLKLDENSVDPHGGERRRLSARVHSRQCGGVIRPARAYSCIVCMSLLLSLSAGGTLPPIYKIADPNAAIDPAFDAAAAELEARQIADEEDAAAELLEAELARRSDHDQSPPILLDRPIVDEAIKQEL
jgi:hypothetical protein